MAEVTQINEMNIHDLHLLEYLQHMAKTAQPEPARLLFKLFVKQEIRLLSDSNE
jgi:hypothetical protein